MEFIQLDPIDLAWALGLMAIAIGLSLWQELGLAGNLAMATLRTLVQLTVVGYVLAVVFAINQPGVVFGVLGIMLTMAAIIARNRIDPKLPRLLPLVWGSIGCSTVVTLTYVNGLIVQPQPWYASQYVIPLAGIVLGNSMTGAAIAGERLLSNLRSGRWEIETHLSLGATPQQAVKRYQQEAIKAGLIPTLNSMMAVGIVQLPGIITGQLLSGANPLDAAAYQILIMFMIAFASLVTTLLVTHGLFRQCFNRSAQMILL
jgi:putative ABC transport system permease protein